MSKVTHIHQNTQPKAGDRMFAMCSCRGVDDPVPMFPIVTMGDPPFISCLVCPECEAEVGVHNGYLLKRKE